MELDQLEQDDFSVKINAEITNLFTPIRLGNAYSENVYHYTSPEELQEVLENKALRFIRADYLNDKSEMIYIYQIFKEVLDENLGNSEVHTIINENFLNSQNEMIVINPVENNYICSLSLNKDELGLWNYYTEAETKSGYNIGFNYGELYSSFCNESTNINQLSGGKVIYNIDEQKDLIKQAIKLLSNFYNYYMKKHILKSQIELNIKTNIKKVIYELAPFFKHPAYKNEKEIRIILKFLPRELSELSYYNIVVRNGIFFPYMSIPFDKSAIKAITTSPYIKMPNVEKSIQDLLDFNKFDKNLIKISKSSIPVEY